MPAAIFLFAVSGATPAIAQWDIPTPEGVCVANCDDYEEPYYEEPYYEEPYYQEDYYYEEPSYQEPTYEPTPQDLAVDSYNAGNALLDQGDYWGAEQKFREALQYDPSDSWAWNNLGFALQEQGRYDEAVSAYWSAATADSNNEMAWENYANLNSWLEEQRALDDWNTGLAMLDQERWSDAEYYFRQAVERDPYDSVAYQNLGYTLFMQGRYAEAVDVDRRALELDPGNAQLQENLFHSLDWHAWQLANEGARGEAIAGIREAIGLAGGDPELREILRSDLTRLLDSADPSAQEDYARLLVELDPDVAASHQRLGQALMAQGNVAAARDAYVTALDLAPNDDRLYMELGRGLFDAGRPGEALIVFERALAIPGVAVGDKAAIQGFIGLSHQRSGDHVAAAAAFEKSILLEPDEPLYHVLLGQTLAEAGAPASALSAFQAALALDPADPGALEGRVAAERALGGDGSGNLAADGSGGAVTPFDWDQPGAALTPPAPAPSREGEATAAGQLSGLGHESEGTSPEAARAGSADAAKAGAATGFDIPGRLGEGMDAMIVDGRNAGSIFVLDNIPEPIRTPEVVALVEEGQAIKAKIEQNRETLATIPRSFANSVEIVTLKDQIAKDEQQLASVSFSLQSRISEETRKLEDGVHAPAAANSGDRQAAPGENGTQ